MKSQERHELKTNELADWLEHFPQWLKKNKGTVIYVIVLILVVVAAWLVKRNYTTTTVNKNAVQMTNLMSQLNSAKLQVIQGTTQGADSSYVFADSATDLEQLAGKLRNKQMAAEAYIARGDALRLELCYRSQIVNADDIALAIEPARQSYQLGLDKAGSNNTLVAKAKLGLGLCEEQIGNTNAARAIYQEILANADFAPTTAAAQAKTRLAIIDSLTGEVILVNEPIEMPVIEPQIEQMPAITFGDQDTNTTPSE